MTLELLPQNFAVIKLPYHSPIPEWANQSNSFFSITRTRTELSIVCEQNLMPENKEAHWRAFRVQGTLDFSLTGILSSIANPLAAAQISIFAVSTFDTDYILVKQAKEASEALSKAGFTIHSLSGPGIGQTQNQNG